MRNVVLIIFLFSFFTISADQKDDKTIYSKLGLKGRLSYKVFNYALRGHRKFVKEKKVKSDLLTIIDYTKPSTKKRLIVIDLKEKKIVFDELVAHGKNTGANWAKHFSNKPQSLKSSAGFFITGGTYYGKHGYSLKLKGMEKGINDNAEKRAVVMHGAWYVNNDFLKKYGRLGRSWGCPALDKKVVRKVIDKIKYRTTLFVYAGEEWVKRSKIIR